MKTSKHRRQAVTEYGKGAVCYSLPQGKNGPISLRVNFRFAPPPKVYYYADALSIDVDREMGVAFLAFGRTSKADGALRDRLEVVMPENALFVGFWNTAQTIEPTVDQQLEALKLRSVARTVSEDAPLRGTLFANLIFAATGAAESCLDFYYLPVRDLHFARTECADVSIQPIVRILASPVLLKHMFKLCRQHAERDRSTDLPRRSERANVS